MKWPPVLRARRARTFPRTLVSENARCSRAKLRENDAGDRVVMRSTGRGFGENRFIVYARSGGENDFASRNIRNSISLTMRRARRMICASHQLGA
jgi:hypothetical protein